MKTKLFAAILMLFLSLEISYSQVSITNAAPAVTVNFSSTMQTSVGSNPSSPYTAAGFEPNPTVAGRLNSNAWEIKGWSYGNLLFGGTQTVDDYSRGPVVSGVITPGMYVYTELPGSAANPAMMIQPGAGDFDPGTVALKIQNNGTTNLTQLAVNYNLFVRNDENTSSAFNFSHSADNLIYVNEPILNYTSPDVADAFQWVAVDTAPSRTCIINGLNVPPGGVYYIRWSSFLVSGTGDSDEFGLDDINITGTYGSPAPEINLTCYGSTLLSGDVTPTVGEGTEFAPSFAPLSTLLTTLQISYTIQNLGGLPLNITNITITGTNAADFMFSGTTTGSIPAASATISTKSFTIIFDPSASGLRTARVNIFSNDSDENPYWFDIQGYGIVPIPDIRINGGPTGGLSIVTNTSMIPNINNNTLFSNQIVGGAGEVKGFVIRNDCPQNAPLLLTDPSPYITIGGNNPSDFTVVTFPTGNSILPGFTKNFTIKFAPTATGIRNAIVSIANNDPDENPFTFLVQGTGVAPEMDVTGNLQPIISGSTTTSFINHTFFDNLNIATGTLDRTFTITNSGNVVLTIGALTLTGANPGDFSVITLPPATLAIGASTTFVIRFDPTAFGLREAIVNIVNTDPNENPYTFAISGFGLNYIPCAFGIIETIGRQDFEVVPATPVWTYTSSGTTAVTGGTGFAATGDGGTSARFIGVRSLQVVNGTGTVTMGNINTTQYNDIELNLRLASLSVTNLEGADAADRIMVSISSNGVAGPWSNELEIVGNTDAKWSFVSGAGIANSIYDGNNVLVTFNPGAGGFLTTNGYGTVSISGLPKVANLAVRITLTNNSVSEVWAIDNVSLFGRKEQFATWSAGAWTPSAPTNTVKAIIDGDYNTSANGNISSCKCVINAGRTVTINANNYFDIQSDVDNSGTLIVENGGSLVQHNDLATNIGTIKVKRWTTPMRSYDYSYWSSPVTGQTLFGLSPNTLWDKYCSFNPISGSWAVIPNGADIMLPGKGYIIRAPQSFTTTPAIYNTGEFNGMPNNGLIQTPIVIGASNMNLIGNPYPSAISANSFLSNAANTGVVEGTIYLWTHNTPVTAMVYTANDYAVYNFSGSVGTRPAINPGISNSMPSGNIASGQAFFIKGLTNGQATFNNSMRLTGSNMDFFRNANNPETTTDTYAGIERNRIWLNLSNAQDAFKQTLIGYIEGATNGMDRGFDGELFNANAYVSLYSILEGKTMAIQGRALPFNQEDKVALGFSSNVAGLFEISIENVDGFMQQQNIYLEDKLLNVIHDLKQSSYSFQTAIGTFDNRFELRYTNTTLATDIFANAGNALIVTTNNKQIDLLSQQENMKTATVYDLLGRNIYQNDKVNAKKLSIPNVVSNQQALIVKIVLENGKVITRKVVL